MSASDVTLEVPPDATVATAVVKADTTGVATRGSFADLKVLNTKGIRVSVRNLTYTVQSFRDKKETAVLLNDVSGMFNPGEMTALLGPSGSGKTTFLDLVSGRKTVGEIDGAIHFGGKAPTTRFLRRHTGYVEQFDTLISALTVHEMLMYTAELKRPLEESAESKEASCEKLLHDLGLTGARDVLVGSEMVKGISGGQAKRLNIAIALITDPSVLFLDEPTSGLDSFTANEVMSVVKTLNTDDVTIIATIHSPTAYAFSLFDAAMILCSGKQVYFGPNGPGLVEYALDALPGVEKKSPGNSDIEWLIDVFTRADRDGIADNFAEVYRHSDLKARMDAALDDVDKIGANPDEEASRKLQVDSSTTVPFAHALWTMMKFRTRKNYKDGEYLGPRLGEKVFLSFLIFTLYWGIGDDHDPDNVVNVSSALFMWTTLPAFGAAAYVPQIVMERRLFMRERADGLYRPMTYLVFKMLDEMFLLLPVTLVLGAVVFYAMNLTGSFVLFWLVYYFTLGNGVVLAYLVSAVSPNMEAANAILPTYVVTLLFFAGWLIRRDDIPAYWSWYYYIDLMRYSFGALMINQWEDNDPAWAGGQTLLDAYDLKGVNKWEYLLYLLLFFAAFFVMALAAITHVNHGRR
jgi:ATP-binding cassette subfamily G (WHITE) protein 2